MTRLEKIVTEFRRGMLGRRVARGRCWMISVPLASYLRVLGHDCAVIEGVIGDNLPKDCHVWIELKDGTCIDATADQFSTRSRPMPKVYVGPRPEWYKVVSHAALTLEMRRREEEARQKEIEQEIEKLIARKNARKTRQRN